MTVELYLLVPISGGRGQGSATRAGDLLEVDLFEWRLDLEGWWGDELLAGPEAWVLASDDLSATLEAAELTGLRVGPMASVGFSADWRREHEVGYNYPAPVIPIFRFITGEPAIELAEEGNRYRDWSGADVLHAPDRPGLVVSRRALDVIERHQLPNARVIPLEPDVDGGQSDPR